MSEWFEGLKYAESLYNEEGPTKLEEYCNAIFAPDEFDWGVLDFEKHVKNNPSVFNNNKENV